MGRQKKVKKRGVRVDETVGVRREEWEEGRQRGTKRRCTEGFVVEVKLAGESEEQSYVTACVSV